MVNTYPITEQQKQILAGYTCERLTAHPENQRLTLTFRCRRNSGLARKFEEDAWQEDLEGRPVVHYIVKDPKGQVAMYFSFKCGVLFNPDYVRDVMERYQRSGDLVAALREEENTRKWARDYLESLRSGDGRISLIDRMNIKSQYYDDRDAKQELLDDAEADPNPKHIRVETALPAVELAYFCVNDYARKDWKHLGMGHTMGQTLFWHLVMPKLAEINALVGCEYVYLFAADSSRDATLVNYYESVLHFDRMTHVGAIKPVYDLGCVFMAKRLRPMTIYRQCCLEKTLVEQEDKWSLEDYRKDFFDNFNYTGDLV